ncbi:DNA-3-methyladenine glycosylase I [Sulfurospirillum sp. 1612]|uniref:DNA-3-methyladenine glycosylase I n=1 Tax=Sulfurospirillum sp. 1612 TaxID=3094835 RepID=UPI002F9362B5
MHQQRCSWVKLNEPLYVEYHDKEWGKPLHDDRALFELFCLETQSAGLSWLMILKRREGYREAFEGFELENVAQYGEKDVVRILESGQVIKHRAKIESIIDNAKGFLKIKKEYGSLDRYFWNYVGGRAIINHHHDAKEALTQSKISDAMTKDLKKRGFKFVGSVTLYAFMQACGMVNDHEIGCWCHLA